VYNTKANTTLAYLAYQLTKVSADRRRAESKWSSPEIESHFDFEPLVKSFTRSPFESSQGQKVPRNKTWYNLFIAADVDNIHSHFT